MRPLLVALTVLLTAALTAQPIDPPTFHPPPEPSIGHGHTRSGAPSAPLYHLTDTIVVYITGDVKLDGSCSGATPLYGFQRKEGAAWVDHLPPPQVQMCCGMPSAYWYQRPVGLIPAHFAKSASGKPWVPGEYRVVVRLVGDRDLVGPAFRVVQGE